MNPVLIAFAVILGVAATGNLMGNQTIIGGVNLAGAALTGNLSAGQIATYASSAGFTGNDLQTAVAVALAESSGNPSIYGDQNLAPTAGPSIGLWQINIGTNAHPEYANANLTDPATNAAAAFSIYVRAGYSFEPWATFDPRDGSTPRYLAYLPTAADAVQGLA